MDASCGTEEKKKKQPSLLVIAFSAHVKSTWIFFSSFRAGERQRVTTPPPFPDRTNTRPAAHRPSDADKKRVSERRRRAKPAAAPYYPLNGVGLITVTMTDGLLLDHWDETRGEETKHMQGRI